MSTGPVEYLVLAFPDGKVSDEIAPQLADLVDREVIRILDAVVVTKDITTGDVVTVELDELGEQPGFLEIDAEIGGLIGPDDISFLGDGLDPGVTVAVLL